MIALAHQRVLISGGSRGIGRATALLFARAGADVGITFHTRQADADAVARDIRGLGRKAFVAGGDLSDPAVVQRTFREFKAAFGGLDCFVANAGIWPVDEVPLQQLPVRAGLHGLREDVRVQQVAHGQTRTRRPGERSRTSRYAWSRWRVSRSVDSRKARMASHRSPVPRVRPT